MGQMNFKKSYFFWIATAIIFLFLWVGTEEFITAVLLTGVTIGVMYILFILLAKFFN